MSMRWCLRLGLLLILPLAAGAAPPPERVAFDSFERTHAGALRLQGLLLVPEGAVPERGRAAIIALHGCGGMYSAVRSRAGRLSERHAAYAKTWVDEGYAVLFPDSFGPRGWSEICTVPRGQRTVTAVQRRLDALGALAWLGQQADIDPARVALVGWSHGGSTALAAVNAADAEVTALLRAKDATPFFRTVIAFYPGCTTSANDARWRPATPLAILIGAADDWTPAAPCERVAQRAREAGWPLDLVVYPDAHHGFDAPSGSVRLRTDVPNGVRPGAGVHVGPHPEARVQAHAKVRAILKAAF